MTAVATQLRRGRHRLSREEVVFDQRARMLRAACDVVAEHGYVATSVAQIITRAGVSRETFYQQFESKQDCFIAALEGVIASLADTLDAGLAVRGSPLDRFDEALTRYLAALASDPARARVFLVEIYAAGDDVLSRRLHLQRQFVDGLLALFGGRSERARFRCEALVNATIGAVTARIINDDSGSIPTLRRPLRELAAQLFPDAAC